MLNLRFRPILPLLAGLALAAAIGAPAPADARIYKWTDADGNTVYSQQPPPSGVKAEQVDEAPPPSEDPEAAMESLRERADAFDERREDRQKSDEEREAAAEREKRQKEVCEQLRENLRVLQTNNQVREQGEDGEYKMLPEEQRQARIESTRERIENECGD